MGVKLSSEQEGGATEREVVALSTYGAQGASTRVRVYDWADHCGISVTREDYIATADNQAGTLVRHIPQVLAAEVRIRALQHDVAKKTVIISRQASPFSSGRIEERLLRSAAHSVYDFDDALKFDTDSWLRRFWSKEELWRRAAGAANVVIAGSPILAEQAREFSDNVTMIPSCVEPANYLRKLNYRIGATPRAVWIGSPATEALLSALQEPLLELNRKFGLRLSVISAGRASLGGLDAMTDRTTWTLSGFYEALAHADFGIMPLNSSPYSEGKCSYKLLQYSAAGLPVIGSPVGANDEALKKLGGLAASNFEEWIASAAHIIELADTGRAAIGARALEGVTEHFSFGAWEKLWREAIGIAGYSSGVER